MKLALCEYSILVCPESMHCPCQVNTNMSCRFLEPFFGMSSLFSEDRPSLGSTLWQRRTFDSKNKSHPLVLWHSNNPYLREI